MITTEREELLAKLAAGRAELLAALEGMSDAEALATPEGRWSAVGNVEHLAMVEHNLMRGIAASVPVADESVRGREAGMFEAVKRRDRKFSAPARVHPTGECRSLAEAVARFDTVRAATIAFLEACTNDLRLCPTTHPLVGPLTSLECLHLIAAHPFRHAAQIRELRQA